MKKLKVFIFSIVFLSGCQKDNNDCNEAISYCNESNSFIIIPQYVDAMMLPIPIGKLQNVMGILIIERANVRIIKN